MYVKAQLIQMDGCYSQWLYVDYILLYGFTFEVLSG